MKSLVVIGHNGVGKTTFANYVLTKIPSYHLITTGKLWDDYARSKGRITEGQKLSHKQRTEIGIEAMKEHGNDFMLKLLLPRLNREDHYIIDGVRQQAVVDGLRNYFGDDMILIGIEAPEETRFRRLNKRERCPRVDFDKREKEDSQYDVAKLLGQCDRSFSNDSDDEKPFCEQIDEFLETLNIVS